MNNIHNLVTFMNKGDFMDNNLQPHIKLGKDNSAAYAILPGDPERVLRIKEYLDNPVDLAYNREFRSITGYYKGTKLLVVSTGIGGASTGIAVEELNNIGVKTLIRIGSCGALKKEIKLGNLVIASGAVRDDGASKAYIESIYPAVPDTKVLMEILNNCIKLGVTNHCGIIRSHDSFYTDKEDEIDKYWGSKGVLCADMESAALFTIGALRGIRTASILNAVVEADGSLDEGINNYGDMESRTALGEKNEILVALETINNLHKISDK